MTRSLLFVYGTLKRGQSNEFRMGDSECLGPVRTLPIYRLYSLGWHPGMVLDRENGLAVEGELWSVDTETIGKLDEFEGSPHYFRRENVALADIVGDVEAYMYQGELPTEVPTGNTWPMPA